MTTFYLKYRPQTLDDLDLVEVRNTLKNMVKSGSIPHALLFSGPRGSGKTSAARILAKIINCGSSDKKKRGSDLLNPCNDCDQCRSITQGTNIDVIEMDAASHRGIDDVRTLRDAVKLSPVSAKKKVYIIDEAHMLTTEASNALLKTLEEPPDHVVFILATTNPEKLIETIRSRTTMVNFNKASDDEIVGSLHQVLVKEKIKVDEIVLVGIAKNSDGSFRDAKKILEQMVSEGIVSDTEKAMDFLTKNNLFDIGKFFKELVQGNTKATLELIENAIAKGVSAVDLNEKILFRLHSAVLSESGLEGESIPGFSKTMLITLAETISEKLAYQNFVPVEQLPLELAVTQWIDGRSDGGGSEEVGDKEKDNIKKEKKNDLKREEIKSGSKKYETKDQNENPIKENSDPSEKNGDSENYNEEDPGSQEGMSFGEDLWTKVLTLVRPKNPSTEALLRAAKPMKLSDEYLFLGVYYSFHKEKLESIQHKTLLEDTLETVIGKRLKVQCFLTEPPTRRNSDDFSAPAYEQKEKTKNTASEEKQNTGYNFKESLNEGSKGSEVLLTEPEDEDIIKLAEEIFGK